MQLALFQLAAAGTLLRHAERSTACLSKAGIADGYSRVGCYQDGSPDSVRTSYKEAIANGLVPGALNRQMGPSACFQFCRDKPGARFFMILHSNDCYCTEYFHDISTGGGTCDAPCESDNTQMCGGTVKASAFEMHTCGNAMDLADTAANSASEEGAKADTLSGEGLVLKGLITDLAVAWELPICSKAAQICELRAQWEDQAQQIYDAALRAGIAANATVEATDALREAQEGNLTSAEGLLAVEQGIATCREAMSGAATKGTVVQMAIAESEGSLRNEVPEGTADLFASASTNFDAEKNDGWRAICSLAPLSSRSMFFAGSKIEECEDACVAAGDDCVGLNYQLMAGEKDDGIFACQLLSDEGVFEQDDAIRDAYGVFEVSQSKVTDMGLHSMDCMLKKAFQVRNGGLTQKTIDRVFVEA